MSTKNFKQFIDLCYQAESQQQLEQLLNFFLTAEEQKQLETRLLLSKELLKGEKTQREIAHDFHISIAKITRGSNNLKAMAHKNRAYLAYKLLGIKPNSNKKEKS